LVLVLVFILVIVFIVVFVFILVVLFVILLDDVGALEHGERQLFAEKVAFHAHPEAKHLVLLDVHDGHWLTAGFQHDDIATLELHGFVLRVDPVSKLASRHDRPITRRNLRRGSGGTRQGCSGNSSVSERMMRSGLTGDPSGRPSPWASSQIA